MSKGQMICEDKANGEELAVDPLQEPWLSSVIPGFDAFEIMISFVRLRFGSNDNITSLLPHCTKVSGIGAEVQVVI